MAISLNSVVVGFNTTHGSRSSSVRAAVPRVIPITAPLRILGSRRPIKKRISDLCLSVADSDNVATDTSNKDSGDSVVNATSSLDSPKGISPLPTSVNDAGPQTSKTTNGSVVSSDSKQDTPSSSPNLKRSPLTARERLRAARVLSRNSEPKAAKKSQMGSKVLEALRESDRGKKRSGLPEAPRNMLDDSKRGMPKQGLTWDLPGGVDLFVIAFSFVFISTVMLATTYIVWKVGAIHFNEF